MFVRSEQELAALLITTHGARMKLGHENNYSSSVKLHDYQEETVARTRWPSQRR